MKKFVSMFVAVMMIFTSVAVVPSAYAAAPKAITLSKTSQTVYIGQKYTLKVKAVTPKKADTEVKWKTSDKKIATVSSKGVVTGKKKGTVTITAVSKSNSKIKAKCKVTVKKFKTTTISHGGNIKFFEFGYVFDGDETPTYSDPNIIKTYSQLKTLKKRIEKHYEKGIEGYDYRKEKILKELNKYDKKYFKTKALYYNCIQFSYVTDYERYKYSFDCNKVQKKINSKGKLTCIMNVKRKITSVKKSEYINCYSSNAAVYFIELNKKDIKGVQKYHIKHYEEIELEFKPIKDVTF